MGFGEEGSKNGRGYVGGFIQLFDWKAKSKKKLFSDNSDLPERSKQGKKNDGDCPLTQLHLIDGDETGAGPSIKGSCNYSCASSVTDDEGFGARAPGVVAKLMGLDCLPTSNSVEPNVSPFFDSQSLHDYRYDKRYFDFHNENHIMHAGNQLYKVDGSVRNHLESKPQKMLNRPIEKFQTEILPPKSAKSIPITHHKLLSPMKSPGFISTKNAAHLMEAAAKIIESGPQSTTKVKMPLVGSSSVPLKVRNLKEKAEASQKVCRVGVSSVSLKVRDTKEKVEASHKPSGLAKSSLRSFESDAAMFLNGQSMDKSWNGSIDTISFRASPDVEDDASGTKNKTKSTSLAIQAKVNVQRREGMNSSSSRRLAGQKERIEVKSSQPHKIQSNAQKNLHKKSSTNNAAMVLRQNKLKQNGLSGKEKLPSKSVVSDMWGGNLQAGDYSFGRQKISSKFERSSKLSSRKLGLEVTDNEKEAPYSSAKNFRRKKRPYDEDFNCDRDHFFDLAVIEKDQKSVQPNKARDRHFSWAEESQKKGMDIVSFTFTAPLARSMYGTETSTQVPQITSGLREDNRGKNVLLESDGMKPSSLGYNAIGGDALSLLLEQKLRELTYAVELSSHGPVKADSASSSASIAQDLKPTNAISTVPRLHDRPDQPMLHRDTMRSNYSSAFSTTDPLMFRLKHQFQGVDGMDECSGNNIEARQLHEYRHLSPVSILEPPFSTESCNLSDISDSNSLEGKNGCSSFQAQEATDFSSRKKSHTVRADVELSDSGNSASAVTYLTRSTNWELEYVKDILCNVELMFKDYALGRTHKIVNPRVFYQLESRIGGLESNHSEFRLHRKMLFDCVSECLDLRSKQYIGGGCRTWMKGLATMRRKERLAEELYKEISHGSGTGDCIVDDLVDRDMSSKNGKWREFEVNAFVLGAEIEGQIVSSLVDEMVADMVQF